MSRVQVMTPGKKEDPLAKKAGEIGMEQLMEGAKSMMSQGTSGAVAPDVGSSMGNMFGGSGAPGSEATAPTNPKKLLSDRVDRRMAMGVA